MPKWEIRGRRKDSRVGEVKQGVKISRVERRSKRRSQKPTCGKRRFRWRFMQSYRTIWFISDSTLSVNMSRLLSPCAGYMCRRWGDERRGKGGIESWGE